MAAGHIASKRQSGHRTSVVPDRRRTRRPRSSGGARCPVQGRRTAAPLVRPATRGRRAAVDRGRGLSRRRLLCARAARRWPTSRRSSRRRGRPSRRCAAMRSRASPSPPPWRPSPSSPCRCCGRRSTDVTAQKQPPTAIVGSVVANAGEPAAPGGFEGGGGHRERARARSVLRGAPRTDRRHAAAARHRVPAAQRRGALMFGGVTREGRCTPREPRGDGLAPWSWPAVRFDAAACSRAGSAARCAAQRSAVDPGRADGRAAHQLHRHHRLPGGRRDDLVAHHAHVRRLEVARAHPDARRQAARVPAQALRQRRRSAVPDSGVEEDHRREAQRRGLVSRRCRARRRTRSCSVTRRSSGRSNASPVSRRRRWRSSRATTCATPTACGSIAPPACCCVRRH